jgi:uncharacterized membrane-anchored protein YhcB (DUF1043 family)
MYVYNHDYKKRYMELFNGITDIMRELSELQQRTEQEIIADENNSPDEQNEQNPA